MLPDCQPAHPALSHDQPSRSVARPARPHDQLDHTTSTTSPGHTRRKPAVGGAAAAHRATPGRVTNLTGAETHRRHRSKCRTHAEGQGGATSGRSHSARQDRARHDTARVRPARQDTTQCSPARRSTAQRSSAQGRRAVSSMQLSGRAYMTRTTCHVGFCAGFQRQKRSAGVTPYHQRRHYA